MQHKYPIQNQNKTKNKLAIYKNIKPIETPFNSFKYYSDLFYQNVQSENINNMQTYLNYLYCFHTDKVISVLIKGLKYAFQNLLIDACVFMFDYGSNPKLICDNMSKVTISEKSILYQFLTAREIDVYGNKSAMSPIHFCCHFMKINGYLFETKTILENIFICLCSQRSLSHVLYFIEKYPTIDISARNNLAFIIACRRNNLDTARWLLKNNPNIDVTINDNEIMKWAQYKQHIRIMRMIESINPILYEITVLPPFYFNGFAIINSRKCTYHHEKWKRHLQRKCEIQHALWLSSSKSPNKKSIWYLLPSDITRYIVQSML